MYQLQIFKPQSFQKDGQFQGAAMSLQLGNAPKGKAVYLSLVRQKSWDATKRLGSFYNNKDEGQSARIKFNEIEVGGLISAIRLYENWSGFHSFDDNKTQITFSTYQKKAKEGEKEGAKAFSLTVSRNGLKIGLGIERSEAEAIRVFLEQSLVEMMRASYEQSNSAEFREANK